MDQYRQYFARFHPIVIVDFCASNTLHNRVNSLEMRRVWCDIHQHLMPIDSGVNGGMAQVVLYIPIYGHIVERLSFKFRENLLARLTEDVRKYI